MGPAETGESFRGDWIDDLIDDVDDINDDLDDAADAIASVNGPLIGPSKDLVASRLASVVQRIDDLLDTGVYPSIPDAEYGSVDPGVEPTTLADYGGATTTLAEDALAEIMLGPGFDGAYVASRLKTIRHLITRADPHSYRSRAGV